MILKFFLFTYFLGTINGEYSPVFLWGTSSPLKPVLEKITAIDFASLAFPNLSDAMAVVFIDDKLSSKDLSSCKLSNNEFCFSKLSKKQNKILYTSVEDPVSTLKKFNLNEEEYEISDNNTNPDINTKCENNKLIFVKFSEPFNEYPISESFAKRDDVMDKITRKLSKNCKLIGMYTGKPDYVTLKRTIRQTSNSQENNLRKTFNINNKFLMYFSRLTYRKGNTENDKEENLEINSATIENENNGNFDVVLVGKDHKIKLNVIQNSGYWQVNTSFIDDIPLRPDYEISAAKQFSYYCGNQIMSNKTNSITLIWYNLQMEPNFNAKSTEFNFDDPWHCVGFTSGPILSGLLITFLMLAILTFGVTWLMDIRTMDRFDDPKGKTITINTVE